MCQAFFLQRLSASEELLSAHNLEEVEKLRIMAYQGEGTYEADVDYAHLTVDWIRNIKTDYAKHDSH